MHFVFFCRKEAPGTEVSLVVVVAPYSWSAHSQSLEPIFRAVSFASFGKLRANAPSALHSGMEHSS